MKLGKSEAKQRLRKQPRMRRVYTASAVPLPDLSAPDARAATKTAQKRKRRNSQQRIRRPLSGVAEILLSPRWLSLGILGLCAWSLFMIGGDNRFFLNYIPVEGASSLDINHVVAESGLAGRHIFAADPQEAADRIGAMDGVITATVTLHWPSNVLITMREKPPLATWQEGDQSYWIDEDGGLSVARSHTVGLLNIVSELPADTTTNSRPQAAGEQTGNGQATADAGAGDGQEATGAEAATGKPDTQVAFVPMDVLEGALQLRELRPNIEQLYYSRAGGLSYQDGRGWRAYFGTGRDMHQKLVVYETVVAQLMARGIRPEYISVSNQYKPYYRPAP